MRIKTTIVFQKNWDAITAKNEDGSQKYRYIINEGSSRSSKTYSIIDCFDSYARANSNKRCTAWRDTKTDCKKTVLNDVQKHLKATGRWKLNHEFNISESIIKYSNSSTFEIHGTDDEETLHGLSQDAAWLNEPYKISKETFDQIDQRTSDFILIDWNPKKAHWIDKLKNNPRTIVIHSTFKDNPLCPANERLKILSYQPISFCFLVVNKLLTEQQAKEYDCAKNDLNFDNKHIDELVRCKQNEYQNSANAFNWCVYGLGIKSEKPNRIFFWKQISYDEWLKIESPVYYGCDWGKSDAWGIVECKYYDGNIYFHELNYLSENEIRQQLSIAELTAINAQDEGIVNYMFGKLKIDKKRPIICDNNRLEKIAMLRRFGYNAIIAAKGAGSILSGIELLDNLNCFYTSTSANLANENENYSWVVDRYGVITEEPEDANNHLHDPARYIVLYLQSIGVIKRI